uniref:Uncharacterized protein n=1 Tax=Mola mola TaxID=94237 RepID=A0A3Q3W5G9_MOLML
MVVEQRFVISARIIGAVHRDTPKLKMTMISVSWSDQSEVIIHRSFQDFKKFHRQLKKKFPQLNPFRKNNRVIPKFKVSTSIQKGSVRSFKRMMFLETYCVKLLKCDEAVTHSSEVTQFFTPKDHDLQPDFTKNRSARQSMANVTHPFVTQTYRCVDAYETRDTKNRPFKVAVDEKLDVLIKDPAGWWLVENENKCLAWFPAPYLELWEGEEEDAADQLGGETRDLYCAVRSYSTSNFDEVSVSIGSVVEVMRKSDDGWWLIRYPDLYSGYIPSMYLQPYSNLHASFYTRRHQYSSTLNLAVSREPQASPPPRANEENIPQLESQGRPRGVPGRLLKAQSLDVLSETWSGTLMERDASTAGGRGKERGERSHSCVSSSSDSSSSLKGPSRSSSPDLSYSDRRSSNTSSDSGTSVPGVSTDSATAPNAPKIPPRPKTEEILTRCTTMTRKAALATKTRLSQEHLSGWTYCIYLMLH